MMKPRDRRLKPLENDLNRLVNTFVGDAIKPNKNPNGGALAIATLALVDTPALRSRKVERDLFVKRLLSMQDESGQFKRDAETVEPYAAQVLIATALIAVHDQTRDKRLIDAVSHARTAIWAQADKQLNGMSAPWLIMLEQRMAKYDESSPLPTKETRDKRDALLAEQVKALQQRIIRKRPPVGPADVVGGMVNINRGPKQAPKPTWRTAHGLLTLAYGLPNPAIVAEDQRLLLQIDGAFVGRFLGQLTFRKSGCYYVRNDDAVLGCVRASLWDNRVAIAPTAMSLLAICEFQSAVNAVQE